MYSGSVFCGMMSHVFYGVLMIALDAANGSFETTSLLYAVVQEGRLPSYLASFAFSGALLALLLFIDRLIGRKRGTWPGFLKVERPEAMSASEVLILTVAILTVLSSCAESFISICRF